MNFEGLGRYLDSLYEKQVPGCDVIIYRDHREVYRHMAGFRDEARTQPVRGDELYCLYSCTKVLTSCAAMQLIEQGRLGLDDPVAEYLPEYGKLRVRTRVDLTKGGPGSIGEFGWDGAAGSWVMIDPHRRVSAFYAMHIKNFGYCYDVIHPAVRTMIYEGLEQE